MSSKDGLRISDRGYGEAKVSPCHLVGLDIRQDKEDGTKKQRVHINDPR